MQFPNTTLLQLQITNIMLMDDPICSGIHLLYPRLLPTISWPACYSSCRGNGDIQMLMARNDEKAQAFGEKIIALIESYSITLGTFGSCYTSLSIIFLQFIYFTLLFAHGSQRGGRR